MLGFFTSLAVAAPLVSAIVFPPNSPCSGKCGNLGETIATDDIECDQKQNHTDVALLFASCLDCELGSPYFTADESDTTDALYNLRFTASYCLWGYPENKNIVDSPCITSKACGAFEDGVKFGNLSVDSKGYDYCEKWPTSDSIDFDGCVQCIESNGDQFLANYMTILQAGCKQKPEHNTTLSYEGEVFSTQVVNVTEPTPSAKIDPAWFDHGPINLGAKVGIAIGGFVLLLIVTGAFIICNGKRRRRAYLRKLETKYKGWPTPQNQQGDMMETPVSQRPLRGWDDSPVNGSVPQFQQFSPYQSHYNSPVNGQENAMQWPEGAVSQQQQPQQPRNIGVALADTKNTWVQDGKQPEARNKGQAVEESYEMHEVDSTSSSSSKRAQYPQHQQQTAGMSHPGYGGNHEGFHGGEHGNGTSGRWV